MTEMSLVRRSLSVFGYREFVGPGLGPTALGLITWYDRAPLGLEGMCLVRPSFSVLSYRELSVLVWDGQLLGLITGVAYKTESSRS